MSIFVRIWAAFTLVLLIGSLLTLHALQQQIKPNMRQVVEDTLADNANLIAGLVADDLRDGRLENVEFDQKIQAALSRDLNATIRSMPKTSAQQTLYITDAQGMLRYDSTGQATGQDYSRWNDVYLTLRGEYGARSTREDPADENSSVMYVAAPIKDGAQIIGVVSVAKPNQSLQPYIERSQRRLGWLGAGLIVLGLLIGGALSWWLSGSLRQLTRYAGAVSRGERAELPELRGGELKQLAAAVQKMRTELEGKAYVERYVHTLTHELKSPLAAIRGAAELLESEMPAEQRQRFVANIASEGARLQQLIERLLNLALVEQRQGLEERVAVDLHGLAEELLQAQAARIQAAGVRMENAIPPGLLVQGERFLLRQALANLLDNALDFTPAGGLLRFSAETRGGRVELALYNQGAAIPDYALPRLTERFYSLPRPASGRKSTGLGLNFVQEVALLHGGELALRNVEGGVRASLHLPLT